MLIDPCRIAFSLVASILIDSCRIVFSLTESESDAPSRVLTVAFDLIPARILFGKFNSN